VAITLGLLVSELSKEPWKGRGNQTRAPVVAMRAHKGVNLQAIFNKILNVAVAEGFAVPEVV
jgi:hypothetical protein